MAFDLGAGRPSILAAVHRSELTGPEQRVLGCLIEKRWTTPDQYPLSLNALRLACNQATNREPITGYDETTVREAAQRLSRRGLARLASGHQSRAIKYRHLTEDAFGLDRPALALICVLLLRGPQTAGELKSRSERMASATLAEVESRLTQLGELGYIHRLPRRPGQKEDRFEHLLGGADPGGASANQSAAIEPDGASANDAAAIEPPGAPAPASAPAPAPASARASASASAPAPVPAPARAPASEPLADRVAVLEAEVRALRDELAALRHELAARRAELG